MGKKKDRKANVIPIGNSLDAVVKDFKKHMKTTGVKLKDLTYDQVLERLVDHSNDLIEERSRQATAIDAGEPGQT
jgi:uncharacterized membrane-anchored protein YhcB (DUF1043 family)